MTYYFTVERISTRKHLVEWSSSKIAAPVATTREEESPIKKRRQNALTELDLVTT